MLTGGKFSPIAKARVKKEEENLAAGRPMDEGTGGIAGKLNRLIREVSSRSSLFSHLLTASECHVPDDR